MSHFKEIQKIAKELGLVLASKDDTNLTVPTFSEVDIKHYLESTSMCIT